MKKVRLGTFETNSSSTHSICIVPTEDYDKWDKNEMFLSGNKLITKEELIKQLDENGDSFEDFLNNYTLQQEYDIYSSDGYIDSIENDYLDAYHTSYKHPNGTKIEIFGQYGYNG